MALWNKFILNSYKRRLAKFRQSCLGQQGIVIVENEPMTSHLFPSFQKFVVIDLNLTILPVHLTNSRSAIVKMQPIIAQGRCGVAIRRLWSDVVLHWHMSLWLLCVYLNTQRKSGTQLVLLGPPGYFDCIEN